LLFFIIMSRMLSNSVIPACFWRESTRCYGSPIEPLGDDGKAKGSRSEGVEDSRIRGVKWRKIEDWKVGGLEV